jgi:integrase/recombinase XerD
LTYWLEDIVELFEQFIRERQYLKNVSPRTVDWYRDCLSALRRFYGQDLSLDNVSRESLKRWLANMMQGGPSPVSCNTFICGVNAFLNWLHQEGHLAEKIRIPKVIVEHNVLRTLTADQVQRIIQSKPTGRNQTRARMVALIILDSGLRISEVLRLRRTDVDFDNLVIRVLGKGKKERLVPMSFELRKALFRYTRERNELLFGTRNGTVVSTRNFERDFRELGLRLHITGVRCSPHTLRHTFAVNYLRAGGNLFYLSKILGHSSVKTTERYLQSLQVEDLQAVHNRLSLLARG